MPPPNSVLVIIHGGIQSRVVQLFVGWSNLYLMLTQKIDYCFGYCHLYFALTLTVHILASIWSCKNDCTLLQNKLTFLQ